MTDTAKTEFGNLDDLASYALTQGVAQVKAAGSPLHPFLIDEAGNAMFLVDNEGGNDPMSLALAAIRQNAPTVLRAALVIDSRITYKDGKKWDAIVVMACERHQEEGVVLAQRYVPNGLFRKFRTEGESEQIAASKNFIQAALAEG